MTFKERYQYDPVQDFLGKGGFARVYRANDVLLDREVAIKVFNATDKGHYTVIEEIKKAIRLEHANLLRYYDVAILESTNALGEKEVIQIGVMELANAGDLKLFAANSPQSPMLATLLKQVLSGLEYLHQKGIVHRDLKPQNILLTQNDGILSAKISDFGISKNLDASTNSSSMAIGTIEYMAPEQFNPSKYGIQGKIGTNVDLWSFGIMVYELITNQPLFGQRGGNTTAEQIMNAILSSEQPEKIHALPEPYKTIVQKCLVSDANLRVQQASELIRLLDTTSSNTVAPETLIFERPKLDPKTSASSSSETLILPKADAKENPVSIPNQTIDAEKNTVAPKLKSKNRFGMLAILLLILGIAGIFLFRFKNAKLEITPVNIDSAKTLMNQKKYQEAIAIVKDSVMSPGAEKNSAVFSKALPVYTISLLGMGDTTAALPLLEKAAQFNDAESAYQLGNIYFNGKFSKQDFGKARQYFSKAAEMKDSRAQVMLGNMYFMGQGVAINYNTAIDYYFAAAGQGNAVAMYALGIAYLNGAGVPKDLSEAKKWLQKVVAANNDAAAVPAAKEQLKNLQ